MMYGGNMKKVYKSDLYHHEIKQCKCDCGQDFQDDDLEQSIFNMMEELELITDKKIALYITSWNRCESNNKRAGGSHTSLHMSGKAVDFVTVSLSNNVEQIIDADIVAETLNKYEPEVNEIIIYNGNRLHFGISDKKVRGDKR